MARIVVAPPAGVPSATNAPEFTVSELSNALKRTIEDRFGLVRVRGEISNFRGIHTSGHAYFSLKDSGARLDAVIWKTSLARLKHRPEEGLEVIAVGRITTFPGKSAYQIVIETLEPAGAGALMALLEERRKNLLAEGLFAPERKKPLPYLPGVVGVITSPTGAVIRDILHRLADRFPRQVVLWPVRVQGETAAAEIAAAIAGFDARPIGGAVARPDVLILARGGGSLEDLWAFNEEVVVRAVAACTIPVVSAVGHETDTTLVDFAADLRAPTPTAAAEKCVPVRADLLASVADLSRRRHGAKRRLLDRARSELRGVSRALPTRDGVLALPRQRTDRASDRLAAAAERSIAGLRARLARAAMALARHTPVAELRASRGRVDALVGRLLRAAAAIVPVRRERATGLSMRVASAGQGRIATRLRTGRAEIATMEARRARAVSSGIGMRREKVEREWKLVESLGYRNVLARGFALVRDGHDRRPLKSGTEVKPGAMLELEFVDGLIGARAEGGVRARRTKPVASEQETLF